MMVCCDPAQDIYIEQNVDREGEAGFGENSDRKEKRTQLSSQI